ncbi:hypothetical protein, partial [Citrobacter sp. JUb117]|uniref:hypothetical protein n=1 Tax=Citrobacter sp. JUb117 TaxID=2940600 RepID=UPI0021698E0F
RDLVFIFRLATLRIRIFECPHRLSDKLLKSSAASLFSAARGVHITPSRYEVKLLFCLSPQDSQWNPADPAACNPLFRVSGGAL